MVCDALASVVANIVVPELAIFEDLDWMERLAVLSLLDDLAAYLACPGRQCRGHNVLRLEGGSGLLLVCGSLQDFVYFFEQLSGAIDRILALPYLFG
jgi:hypothetical protein